MLTHLLVFFLCGRWNSNDISHPERSLIRSRRAGMKVWKAIILWQITRPCLMSQFGLGTVHCLAFQPDARFPSESSWYHLVHLCNLAIHVHDPKPSSITPLWPCWDWNDATELSVISQIFTTTVCTRKVNVSLPKGFMRRSHLLWGHHSSFTEIHRASYRMWLEVNRLSKATLTRRFKDLRLFKVEF